MVRPGEGDTPGLVVELPVAGIAARGAGTVHSAPDDIFVPSCRRPVMLAAETRPPASHRAWHGYYRARHLAHSRDAAGWFRSLPRRATLCFSARAGIEAYRPARRHSAEHTLADWLTALPIDRAVLMPCSDHRVSEVAALPAALRERFSASVPTEQTLERFVDKGHFADLLRTTGTPHPFSKPLSDVCDLDDVPDAIFGSAMLKPRDSQSFIDHFRTKALHVTSRTEAVEQLARVREAGFAVILQEYIPGPATDHYFVDGFIDRHGTVRAIFVRQRLRMYPLDFGNSTAMVSVEPGVASQAVASITSLLTGVGYRGIFSAEFKRDPRDGVFKILEVNTRPWWYVDFAARCGVDVCRMAYEDALNRPVETVERYEIGRSLVFPYHDYFACKALRRDGKLSAWGWLRSWAGCDAAGISAARPGAWHACAFSAR